MLPAHLGLSKVSLNSDDALGLQQKCQEFSGEWHVRPLDIQVISDKEVMLRWERLGSATKPRSINGKDCCTFWVFLQIFSEDHFADAMPCASRPPFWWTLVGIT
mmetsp:Transcript_107801/g.182329  ORF Transcript_107801/g.182329 Transcript_107801/m.182329 type:complete len:104 (+) Transcript_107801:703-1014(+)